MNRWMGYALWAFGIYLLTTAADAADPKGDLAGMWESNPVRLVRPGLDETFIFRLSLGMDGLGRIMDIDYFTTSDPADKRRIRQDVTIVMDAPTGLTVLQGANPRLVTGPAIIGVYEPDSLYCDVPKAEVVRTIRCTWGSPGHGDAPVVVLTRTSGSQ